MEGKIILFFILRISFSLFAAIICSLLSLLFLRLLFGLLLHFYFLFFQLPLLRQLFPGCPVGVALLHHGLDSGHHLGQQLVAGDADPAEEADLH